MKGHVQEEKIALLAGGDLKDQETHELERHLSQCPACSARLRSYQNDRQALSALRETGIDERDFDSVRQSVIRRLPAERIPPFRFFRLQWGALAATVLTAAVIGMWYWISMPEVQRSGLPGPVIRPQALPAQPLPARGATRLAETHVSRPAIANASRPPRTLQQKSLADASQPAPDVVSEFSAAVSNPPAQDVVVMKLETSDPNVVIIWLASPKGAER